MSYLSGGLNFLEECLELLKSLGGGILKLFLDEGVQVIPEISFLVAGDKRSDLSGFLRIDGGRLIPPGGESVKIVADRQAYQGQ